MREYYQILNVKSINSKIIQLFFLFNILTKIKFFFYEKYTLNNTNKLIIKMKLFLDIYKIYK